jgi:hypothetical protein
MKMEGDETRKLYPLKQKPAPVQEPVAWMNPHGGFLSASYIDKFASGLDKEIHNIPLYTTPPAQPAPVQKPFGYFKAEPFGWTDCASTDEGAVALYEHPAAQRPWIGLSDEEYIHITDTVFHQGRGLVAYYLAIEAKLKELNT